MYTTCYCDQDENPMGLEEAHDVASYHAMHLVEPPTSWTWDCAEGLLQL